MKKKCILYFMPEPSVFIDRDIEMLSGFYEVKTFCLNQNNKPGLIPRLFLQLLFMLFNLGRARAYVCHFATYASLLPAMLGRLVNTPCLVIVAGSDAARFDNYSHGNFSRKTHAFVTRLSLRYAAHILPVHETLVYQDYTYDINGAPAQGYTYFAPETKKTPHTSLPYGYDPEKIKPIPGVNRISNTFITAGNLTQTNLFYRKGYDMIIELARLRPELSFTLVGWDGQTYIEHPENVALMPYLNQEELKKAFSAHEFYFQLSYMEGFPNALCEAMLCGCIPIGSNVSGIPDIIGDTGFILDKRNTALLNQLTDTALNSPKRNMLPEAARKRIAEHFSATRRLQGLQHILEKYTNKPE